MKIKIISVLILFMLPAFALAKNIYVSQNGSGSVFTTDCATGSRSAVWFNTASSWGGDATTILAGDTVHLCGTITTSLQVQDGGSDGLPITIVFETGAKISKETCGTYCLSTNNKDYITIDGSPNNTPCGYVNGSQVSCNGIIEATNNGTGLGVTTSVGILAGHCDNCEIKNLEIHNMYVRNSDADTLTAIAPNDASAINAIVFSGSNILIHNNTIHDVGWAIRDIYKSNDDNVKIYNNDISNCGHALAVAASNGSTTAGSFYYYNNYVHDFANWDSPGCGVAHTSAIHAYGVSGSKITGTMWIYNNRFVGNSACLTGLIYLEGSTSGTPWSDGTASAKVFNNLIIAGPLDRGANMVGLANCRPELYNNTIIGNGAGICVGAAASQTTPKIKNNYIANCAELIYAYAGGTIDPVLQLDHNVYANCSGYNCFWVGTVSTGNFTNYRTNALIKDYFDIHSAADLAGTGGVDATSGRPTVDSLVINGGVNLSNLGYSALNADLAGVVRGAVWDIGAYEYAEDTGSDYKLTLTVVGSGSGTVTSFPVGISSSSSTDYDYDDGTVVTLTATATSPNYFAGWSGTGGCSGTETCQLTMSAARAVTATFSRYGTFTPGAGGSVTLQ